MSNVVKIIFLLFLGEGVCDLQYFLRTPRNTSVAEGDTAVLGCQVGNLLGRVQWTKDGLTLGFDRDLPGFPRYRVLGQDEEGRYNLQISDASLLDDSKYECQVGPASGNPPIRASAYLTVLLPPKKIEFIGHHSGSRIERKENENLEISCKVSDSKPAAEIVWLRNNIPLVDNVEIETKEEDGSLPNRKTVVSKLKMTAKSGDNQATYACEAVHGGLRGETRRVNFLLSVQYPPERPEIIGYIEGETIRMGQTVTLVCESYGGNPLATIIWYKNGQRIDHSYTTMGSKSKNVLRFIAGSDDNNAKYRCEASNIMVSSPLAAEMVMSVQFAPDTVTIKGPEMARINETVTLECETSNSNPASSIQWVIGGRILPAIYTRNDTSDEGGWVTKSNISFTVSDSYRTKNVSCYANNFALSTTKVQSHKITVLYPPDDLTITGYSTGDIVNEGTERRIKCTAVSGNPLPTLEWFSGDTKMENTIPDVGESDSYVSSEIFVKIDRSDNDKVYECRGVNEANPDTPVTKSFKMAVEFPPRILTITVDPEKPVEGKSAVLTCITDTSSPGVEMQWRYNGNILPSTDSVSRPGPFAGVVTTNLLHIDVTTKHVGAVFSCEAKHNPSMTTVHNSTVLTIKYRPQFSGVKTEFLVEEGKSAVLSIGVNAYPEVNLDDYSWEKTAEPSISIPKLNRTVPGTRIVSEGGSLTFNSVVLGDAGIYVLKVKNEVGESTVSVKVAILHPPRFLPNTLVIEVDSGAPAEIKCNVDATPLTASTLSWKRPDYKFEERGKIRLTDSGSVLTLFNTTKSDSGVFTCIANNGVPASKPVEISETFYLLVRHKPDIDKSPGLSKAGFNRGDKAKLLCRATGANNITFFWQKEGQQLATPTQQSKSSKYTETVSKPDPLTWESSLYIEDVGSTDYGKYKCVATNVLGSDEHTIQLNIKSHPDPPEDLQALGVTYKSVTLTWQPGFDGGFKQRYRLRMRKEGSEHFFTVDVKEDVTTFEVGDLQPNSEYSFTIMAHNKIGESNYTSSPVKAKTARGGSSNASSKSATIEMFVGSSYNETMGDTLSDVSDRSSNYFASDMEHRNSHIQDEFDDPRMRGPGSTYLIDHNPIYSSQPGNHPPRSLASVYGTLPKQTPGYSYDEDLSRQRFIHSLGDPEQDRIPRTYQTQNQYQYDLPPPPPPPIELPYTYQNIYPRYLPPMDPNWKGGRFGDV
ncbi:nephrin isoform X4 [Eurytemora carolleeae]|uniref:nephrin isoform X4 n=1 Tax=Eurytemora carolleeae TaxID=1294199 RepID=UPI000C772B20|nr:nephrin isoform X4 [Eurytemora carolleeae]|eukprot:XP_023332616.1 nephrin-like isoform X4 [Eurytemora affinis]